MKSRAVVLVFGFWLFYLPALTASASSFSRDPWVSSISRLLDTHRSSQKTTSALGRPASSSSARRVLSRCDALVRRGKLGEALALVDKALKSSPGNIRLLLARAVILERRHERVKAEKAYRAVLELQSSNAAAMARLGCLLVDRGIDMDGGRRLLMRCLDKDPANAEAADGLGWYYYRKGRIEDASKMFRRARKADTKACAPLYHLGMLALRQHDLAKALTCFQTVVELDPGHDRAYISLGLLYSRLGERGKALDALGTALSLVGDTGPVARRIRAAIRRIDPAWRPKLLTSFTKNRVFPGLPSACLPEKASNGRVTGRNRKPGSRRRKVSTEKEKARLSQSRGANENQPKKKAALLSLLPGPAERTKRDGGEKAAPGTFRVALDVSKSMLQRDLVGTHLRLGKLYHRFGLMRDAAGEFHTVMNIGPLSSEAREAKKLVEAISDFADPPVDEKIQVYTAIGALLFQRGDLENAKLQYKKILLLKPDCVQAHKNLAYVFLKEGKQAQAWSHLVEALRISPENPETLVMKAYILAGRRNFRAAGDAFQRVAALVRPQSRLARYAREMARKMALFTDLE